MELTAKQKQGLEIMKKIEEQKAEFSNREVSVKMQVNEYGICIVDMEFFKKKPYLEQLKERELGNDEECMKLENQKGYIQLDIVGKCNTNEWMGNISPQIFIEDYEITGEGKYLF